ncbi:MAG: hypothetical protein METHP_00709 [Methanoregula sp. SKADARSKE-2]|nr:MAG: hypothetical protein METHP_00709 [Methanoregula sp. SKADARSKE-2]
MQKVSRIGDPAVGPLATLLEHPDDDRYVRSRAGHALGMIGEPVLNRLSELVRTGTPRQRWGATIALGLTGNPIAAEPLIEALGDESDEVRIEAATALAAIGRPAVEPLIRFLKFTRGEIRIEVVRAAGDLHADDALQPLVQLLENAGDRGGGDLGSAERNSCNDRGSDGRRYIGPAGNGR